MSSSKENDDNEKKKLLNISKSLGRTSEANIQKIISCKGKLETVNDKILLNKKLVEYYENKLEELMTEIERIEWSQIKAKTFLEADIQFVKEFKNQFIDNEQKTEEKTVEDELVTNKILELKQEKQMLEIHCKNNDKIIEELYNEFKKLEPGI